MRVRSCLLAVACAVSSFAAVSASAQEVVLHPTDVTTIRGNWARVSSTSGASGQTMSSEDRGWSSPNAALASPGDYFEATFTAQAYVPYRIWLRVRAKNNSKWNESVWVQFNDSLNSAGSAAYRIGSTSAVLMNLEECNGCGVSSWGWTGGSYWIGMNQQVQFPSAGTKTIRIQTREDGGDIDQIVLSPQRYLTSAPGAARNDTTILPRAGGSSGSSTNTAKALPGLIQAQDFDNGANGSAYYDRTSGNNGGQFRAGDVDIERTNDTSGTYNVGWIDGGEWLNYTVNVASAGSYTIEMRVASPNGSQARVRFGGTDVTGTLPIPATGGWQSWRTIQKTVTLSAGTQVMRVVFDSSGANFNWIRVSSASSTPPPSGESGSGPFGGTAWAFPGTVQAEDFDLGGQSVGYYDNSSGNAGGKYRSTDVDIESSSVGYNVGWVGSGEWLNYTVNVASSGTYTLTARVASNGSGGTFYVEFGGVNKTGTMTVPNTGGWSSYRDVNATVSLSAGTQVMRIRMTGNGSTGAVGNFDYIRLASGGTTTTTTNGKIRIMTWNVHFGKNTSGTLNLETQAKIMADSGAHVILLQEASTWDGDQPNKFPALLKSLTGQTWYKVWSSHNGTGSGEGTLILTKLPITSSSIANYYSRGFSRVAVTVSGVVIDIFNGHLDYYDTSKRTSQLLAWMKWMRTFSGPEIAGGDFNSWWGEYWIKEMEKEYSDTWQDVTGSNQNGYTKGNVRFDYLFRAFDGNSRIKPTACWVISTSASDHRPVVADYTVQ